MILPEAHLGERPDAEFADGISSAMKSYLDSELFREYPDSFIYVERELSNGLTRRGIVGAVDLEAYDYSPVSSAPIRASEQTVPDRLPPRVAARNVAKLELPHIIALVDDANKTVIEPLAERTEHLKKLYDFDLMENGGNIKGWLVSGEIAKETAALVNGLPGEAKIIIGDGNHSLAAAKTHWDAIKDSRRDDDPSRYALVELNNVYDPAIEFMAIHRVVFGVDSDSFVRRMEDTLGRDAGYRIGWRFGAKKGEFAVTSSCVGDVIESVQSFIDDEAEKTGCRIDYIHGDDILESLAAVPGNVGIILPAMNKSDFFGTVRARGVFPRKSFSIGASRDKRYYLECRQIA
jgi:uncharacterized protein (DUF1015 family)